jgi:hypothetical protein
MTANDALDLEYVRLGLRIGRHAEGYIDAYIGPPEIQSEIAGEPLRPLESLRDDVARLRERLSAAEMDDGRRDHLTRQLTAMDTLLRLRDGEPVSLVDEVQGCFDFTPERVPEATLDAALREVDTLLPGKGDLGKRRADWNRQFELPKERILPVLEVALAETRRRTLALLDLPPDEGVTLQLVSDKPWSGYNWYEGNGRSRIDVSTDLPVRADFVLNLMAHEAYPGHHTESTVKERRLYRGLGRLEHCIVLLISPECLVGEAIATVAQDVIFPDRAELESWLRDVLYAAAGTQVDVALQLRLVDAFEKLDGVAGNAAFLLHADQRPDEEVLAYLRHYELLTEQEARQRLRFLSNPLSRGYIFNYAHGRRMLKRAFAVGGTREVFLWAVTEPVTPSAIAARYGIK